MKYELTKKDLKELKDSINNVYSREQITIDKVESLGAIAVGLVGAISRIELTVNKIAKHQSINV